MRFFNAAHPQMQQEGYFQGGEQIEIVHLSKRGREAFLLPRLNFQIQIEMDSGAQTLKPVMDTLVLLPDEDRCYCIWRASHPLADLSANEVRAVELGLS